MHISNIMALVSRDLIGLESYYRDITTINDSKRKWNHSAFSASMDYKRTSIVTPRRACAQSGVKQSVLSVDIYKKMIKQTSNTLNTYLYCCKSLPRTVNQICHLPLSLRSKNRLHGLRWGGFWIAIPLPATQTLPRHDITSFTTCTASYSALRMREVGVEMPKRTRKPSLKVRENLQFQLRRKGLYLPLSSKEG